ncbi:unnamed protein product, partial [Polarella glacialis]
AKLWRKQFHEHGLEPVLVPRMAAGLKDPADLMLALDAAEECLLPGRAATVAIASEDVDFAIVLRRVQSWGRAACAVVPDHGRLT